MATVAASGPAGLPSAELRERRFFFGMAIALALTVATGFGLFIVVGISSFNAPWWVHVHAVSFVGWIALYVTQNRLVLRGSLARHRQLGQIGAVLAAWMVTVGLVLTPVTLAAGRSPPFFTPAQFLALDWVNILVFAGLVVAALALRKRTDWHRRLMLSATICVIAPALGRILVLAGAMSPWNNTLALLGYVAVAMLADWRIRGRVHPAYLCAVAALLGMGWAIDLLTGFPPLVTYAQALAAG